MYLRINLWVLLFPNIFALHSVCTTVTHTTLFRLEMLVDIVCSTVFHKNLIWVFATRNAITEADCSVNFTIFHCRMSTIQPAWKVCTTSECWHTRCWHFCSWSSHKTIPSLRELFVTPPWTRRCFVTYLPIGITQVIIMIARIGCKVKQLLQQDLGY